MFHLFTLVSFLTLYTMAFSLGSLAFQFIDQAFPDALSYHGSFGAGVSRNAIAGLIVAFPLYLFLMRLVWKETKANAKNLESAVRKWFTYITLVVVAGVMLGDLIALVSNALGGELALRFVLKGLTVFVIAGSIFAYYLYDLKRKTKDSFPSVAKAFVGLIAVLVVASVWYGIVLSGTPGEQRARQLDQRRVSDLQQISFAVNTYWQRNENLPASFEDFKGQDLYLQSVADPETGTPYEYRATGEQTYELCAVFSLESYTPSIGRPFADPWEHGRGRVCFQKELREPNGIPVPKPAL